MEMGAAAHELVCGIVNARAADGSLSAGAPWRVALAKYLVAARRGRGVDAREGGGGEVVIRHLAADGGAFGGGFDAEKVGEGDILAVLGRVFFILGRRGAGEVDVEGPSGNGPQKRRAVVGHGCGARSASVQAGEGRLMPICSTAGQRRMSRYNTGASSGGTIPRDGFRDTAILM